MSSAAERLVSTPVAKPDNRDLISAALHLLARRDMSAREFAGKLAGKEFTADEIAEVSMWCRAEGFLDEGRYADGKARSLGARYGAKRVSATLKQKGVTAEVIAETVAHLHESEFARARTLWLRKFSEAATDPATRNKHIRFLQARGFGFAIIKRVIAGETEQGEPAYCPKA